MSPKILVVDDDAFVLSAVKRGLTRAGYDVTACSEPAEALGLFKTGSRFALVVSDLEMPGFDGDELCREIQKIAPTPVILCSGHSSIGERARACGAAASFSKPVLPSVLLAAVAKLIPGEAPA